MEFGFCFVFFFVLLFGFVLNEMIEVFLFMFLGILTQGFNKFTFNDD